MFLDAGLDEAVDRAAEVAGIDELVATLPVEAATAVGLVGGVSDIRERLEACSSAGLDEVALVPMTAADPNGERTLRGMRSFS